MIHLHQGNFAESIAFLEYLAQQAEKQNETSWQIRAWTNLVSAYLRGGRLREAHGLLEEGLRLARRVGDAPGEGFFRLHLGTLAFLEGRWTDAEDHFQAARHIAEATNMPHFAMHALVGLATLWALQPSDPDRIARAAQQALELALATGDSVTAARARGWLAWSSHLQGDTEKAWRIMERALTMLAEEAEPTRLALMTIAGYMWALQGHADRAASLAAYVAVHPSAEAPVAEQARRLLHMLRHPLPDHLPAPPPVLL